jgi:hypothetical protein
MPVITPFSQPAIGSGGFSSGAPNNQNGPQGGMDFGNKVNNNGSTAKTVNLLDPSNSNPLPTSGLAKGGTQAQPEFMKNMFNTNGGAGADTGQVSFADTSDDWRVRISVNPGSGVLYRAPNPGILTPLLATDGVIFPFVPSITVNHSAKYGSRSVTHTNYTNYFYESSEVQNLQVTGDFAVQNKSDADYFMAVIYFFRAATKMFYGNSGQYQGSPPPILYLNGFGKHYFPNVPCVLTYFNHQLPNDVDYVETSSSVDTNQQQNSNQLGNQLNMISVTKNRVPTSSTITLQLQPVYSRKRQTEFDHEAFARGAQIDKGFM